jgi:hypothetical protein
VQRSSVQNNQPYISSHTFPALSAILSAILFSHTFVFQPYFFQPHIQTTRFSVYATQFSATQSAILKQPYFSSLISNTFSAAKVWLFKFG